MSDHSDQDSFPENVDEEDIDEDEILANLSPEELKQLQSEMDVIAPDERVPVGQRQRDQTEKTPTGGFDHRSLVDYLYWDKESKRMLDEERVPATLLPSEKNIHEEAENKEEEKDCQYWDKESVRMLEEERVPATLPLSGKNMKDEAENKEKGEDDCEDVEYVYEVVEEIIEEEAVEGVEGEEVIEEIIEEIVEVVEEEHVVELKEEEKVKPLEKVTEPEHQTTDNSKLYPSEDESTNTANTNSNVPLAPVKFEEEVTGEKDTENSKSTSKTPETEDTNTTTLSPSLTEQDPKEQKADESYKPLQKEERKINRLNIPKLALGGIKLTSRPSGNDTNLESTLDKIYNNNPTITEINLNNIENIPKEMLIDYVNALKKNKFVKTFCIANTGADENIAFTLANMLRENRSITTINIESNFITGKGIVAIMRCLQFNETLTELRFHNQRHMLGHHSEMEVSRLLKANNTLLKLGYHFEQAGPRMVVTNLLTRNLDRQRQLRNDEQKHQQLKEQKEVMQMYESSLNLPPGLLEMLGYIPPIELLQQQGFLEPPPQPSTPSQASTPPHASTPPQANKLNLKHTVHNLLPHSTSTDQAKPLLDVQLKRTPKRRDPFLELDPREDRRPDRASFHLRKTTRPRETGSGVMGDERANLKDVIKTLKPVSRKRQPPKVDPTPRDQLLSEIKQSNVAYLKSTPLPKLLESRETSLF
ncbi:leiomodin-3 [Hypomesus transpacificus]|uniref:leiomodin-3 n=1 Tax=Hypomesus transpacificus TaxID=137520 RepID=UPI001F078D06|nr:leiomodin-3 [Hypomesus transpacificus]